MYEKGDKPSLVIATLEALAVLISLKAFYGNVRGEGGTKVQSCRPGRTTGVPELHSINK